METGNSINILTIKLKEWIIISNVSTTLLYPEMLPAPAAAHSWQGDSDDPEQLFPMLSPQTLNLRCQHESYNIFLAKHLWHAQQDVNTYEQTDLVFIGKTYLLLMRDLIRET